ncbi:response regulator transcription factor [Candidatus Nanosyncoccus alces]|uniref:Response regulator ArlR n=1 Tax=Candidatus Nanosyncoccus alces TaxID=2171997 RepID=A0ABY0FL27_9BACT|nr:response regulator transcription factor [Candidatus Nanosyncoccus alces]RYC74412.1 Response regulator ArlR [Candidatus Nanosyncoccus alces]
MRILYVEDEKFLAEAVIHLLKKEKIAVDWAADGEEGLDLALKPNYDAIVLDIMLPKISGLEILKTIRERGVKTPVIMLSALNEVEDKIKGLDLGADDYLAKPFKTSELIARLNALTRRPPLVDAKVISYEDLKFDLTNRTLNSIELTDKEAGIFEMLIKVPGSAVTKEQILAHVWGSEAEFDENYVEVYMSYLRKKLKALKSRAQIKTIRNLGYKLTNV